MKVNSPELTDHLPTELVEFARRQIVNATMYKGNDRRSEGRHHMMLPVRAIPVNEQNQPTGDGFNLITRDISPSAVSLIHSDQIVDRRLAIQMRVAGEDVNVVIEVVWSEPLGPFYGACGQFRDKLDHFPG